MSEETHKLYLKKIADTHEDLSDLYRQYADALEEELPIPGPTGPTGTPTGPTGPTQPPATTWPKLDTQWPYGPQSGAQNIGYKTITTPNTLITNFTSTGIYQKSTGLKISSGKIDGTGSTENGVQFNNYSIEGVEVTRTKDGFKAHGDTTILNCWVHDLTYVPNVSHNDGVQISGGTNIKILKTRFEATPGNPEQQGTAAIFIKPEGNDTIGTVEVDGCVFNRWGNYFLQSSQRADKTNQIEHLIVRNCIFGKTVTYVTWAKTHNLLGIKKITWENNVDIYGNPVLLDKPVAIK